MTTTARQGGHAMEEEHLWSRTRQIAAHQDGFPYQAAELAMLATIFDRNDSILPSAD